MSRLRFIFTLLAASVSAPLTAVPIQEYIAWRWLVENGFVITRELRASYLPHVVDIHIPGKGPGARWRCYAVEPPKLMLFIDTLRKRDFVLEIKHVRLEMVPTQSSDWTEIGFRQVEESPNGFIQLTRPFWI